MTDITLSNKEVNHMNDNKKPDERPEIKELLTHQLQLVSKESEDAHGNTLAALSNAAAYLVEVLAKYKDTVMVNRQDYTPKQHDITGCKNPPIAEVEGRLAIEHAKRFFYGTTGEHTNRISPDASVNGSEWLAAEQDIPAEENP